MIRAVALGALLFGTVAAAQQPVLLEVKGPKRAVAPVAAALTAALKEHDCAPVRVRMPAAPRPAQVRSAFKKADAAKHAMGRATFAALRPLLPFSRNDYWEVSELEERLSR